MDDFSDYRLLAAAFLIPGIGFVVFAIGVIMAAR